MKRRLLSMILAVMMLMGIFTASTTFMNGLKKAGVTLNRKMLAELAVSDKAAFAALAEQAKAAL